MPLHASMAQKKATAPPKRSRAVGAAKPVKAAAAAAKPAILAKKPNTAKRNTADHTATAATQARKQATKGKRKRDELDAEAAEGAAVAGGGSVRDKYDAEIVWSNQRKDEDEQEEEGDAEASHEQYESDDEAPPAKAITAKQLATLQPVVRATQAKIKQQLQQEEASKPTQSNQAAETAAAHKPTGKPRLSKQQKKAQQSQRDTAQTEQPNTPTVAAQEEQEEQAEDDEEADGDDDSLPSQPTPQHTRSRRTRHSSTATPSAAELSQRGVVYLGHLPHGFFEDQMRAFFSQFGEVTRVQLARNPKSGRSRHYGFVEFAHSSVATLVADAMHRYMMFGHTLVATVVPVEQRHASLFDKDGMRFRVVPYRRMAREAHNAVRSADEQERRVGRLLRKDGKKRRQLAEIGIEYDFPGYVSRI